MKTQNKPSDYNPNVIEAKWQEKWESDKVFTPSLLTSDKPYFNLMMFPYPSAEGLHVGNMYAFTGADVHGRFRRMQGNDVFEPIGLDGFGIHSENYALKVGKHPAEQAKVSQANFYRQLRATGNAYDWTRTLETYDPDYYRWTQWLFIQMFKSGLAYRKKAQVNWCPSDKTVLADEQVIDGKCERDGAVVEKRDLEQWFFKITDYADRLLAGLDKIDWPEKIKIAQRQWIGKSEGARINFELDKKRKFIFIHGHNGSIDRDFWQWLKSELEGRGNTIQMYDLPTNGNPNIETQVEFLLDKHEFDEDTVVVAHSLGCDVALKLVPKLKTRIGELILVAPPLKPEFSDGKVRPELQKACDWSFDFEKVKEKVSKIKVLKDLHDDVIIPEHPQEIAKNLDAELIEVVAQTPHFNTNGAETEILQACFDSLEVFTTRPDTLWGATFMVISPEHPLASEIEDEEVKNYIKTARSKSTQDRTDDTKVKTGVFSGIYAVNPVNNEKIPVWIADYVLMGYGTGAIMAVPAHDVRDFEFAKKYNLPIRQVIAPDDTFGKLSAGRKLEDLTEAYVGPGGLVNSGDWDDFAVPEAMSKILDDIEKKGIGKREANYHLRDWLISRQRYWGPPIPMIYCSNCEQNKKGEREDMPGWWTVPEEQLPVLLPEVQDWRPEGDGTSPLANHPEFYDIECPSCSSPARRETDVSDTFLDSAWYYLRYLSIGNHESGIMNHENISEDVKIDHSSKNLNDSLQVPYMPEVIKAWCPVAIYIGGAEHSVLHLLYVRFVAMVLHDLQGSPSTSSGSNSNALALEFEEPFPKFFAHGLIVKDGSKMSKSRGNVVIPDKYIEKFGADTLRMYLMFLGQFKDGGDFRDSGIEGMYRFVKRVWTLLTMNHESGIKNHEIGTERLRFMHKTIKAVTEDLEAFSYNTAIAKMMEWYNFLSERRTTNDERITSEETATFLKLLAPFAPHMTEEIWQKMNQEARITKQGEDKTHDSKFMIHDSIHYAPWPTFDEKYLIQDEVIIPIQVNGKRRGEIVVENGELRNEKLIEEKAKEVIAAYLEGKVVKKVIYIPGKIINFVI